MIYEMIKATLDTDLVFSGLYSNRGASHQILRAALNEEFIPAVSVPLFLEYEAVLKRPENQLQLGLTVEEIDAFLTAFLHVAETIERIYYLWRPLLSDEKDHHLVECAVTSRSDYLVTFNTRHFAVCQDLFHFRVILPKDFLAILRG